MTDLNNCPLCARQKCSFYFKDKHRSYSKCPHCSLVFVIPKDLPSRAEEQKEYELHENDPFDAGYRLFLSRLTTPLEKRLTPTAKGLDFGCGPGPTLSIMMEDNGWEMDLYDPFFKPDSSVFQNKYDFITATEVIEHIHHPASELQKLWNLLSSGGYLAVMTKLVIDVNAFASWHYKNDRTHVCFYSRETFRYLADTLNATLEFMDKDVIFLRKP